jgi:hypothetical protein
VMTGEAGCARAGKPAFGPAVANAATGKTLN